MNNRTIIANLENITKIYNTGDITVTAVSDISLNIFAGDFLAFCGPSGSGKTTILNLLGALDKPSRGTITIKDRALEKMNAKELTLLRRNLVGFIFQTFNLIPILTALENAEFTLNLQKVAKSQSKKRALEALKEVGLAGLEERFPNQLSGGQQQRVAIARAIAPGPSIVLADEPTANLDTKTAISLLNLMEKLNKEKGVTFIFSTHDTRIIERAKRIVFLEDGKIKEEKWC